MMNYTLDELRERINQIDRALLFVLLQRISILPLIAELKRKENIPVHQPERESRIYSSLDKFAMENGINGELLEKIYQLIIEESKKIENICMSQQNDIAEIFKAEEDKWELTNLYNASFLRLQEFSSILECLQKWQGKNGKYGTFVELISILTDLEMNRKYL